MQTVPGQPLEAGEGRKSILPLDLQKKCSVDILILAQ